MDMTATTFMPSDIQLASSPPENDCPHCSPRAKLGFKFSMAFQPIVDMRSFDVFAHEALVRGSDGAGAGTILAKVNDDNRYRFDQGCRRKAIQLASGLGMQSALSINFLPNAVYDPSNCLRATIKAAQKYDFPLQRIIFEITENERVVDPEHLIRIIREYREMGLRTAIDDFGAGYSGLNLLADFQPDLVKLDMALIRDIDKDKNRQSILKHTVTLCRDLGIEVIAEGLEREEELDCVEDMGVYLVQGYLLARPGFETIPEWTLSPTGRLAAS